MTEVIFHNLGTLDKYIGDAINGILGIALSSGRSCVPRLYLRFADDPGSGQTQRQVASGRSKTDCNRSRVKHRSSQRGQHGFGQALGFGR